MITTLTEIFSSNSDKARLIAILISSLVAISVLLLNQWFINKRERRKLLIEKIESISKLVAEFDRSARSFLLFDSADSEKSDAVTFVHTLEDIEMLLHLYFPKNVFIKSSEQHQATLNLKNELLKHSEPGMEMLASHAVVIDIHEKQIAEMRSKCRELMKTHT